MIFGTPSGPRYLISVENNSVVATRLRMTTGRGSETSRTFTPSSSGDITKAKKN